MPTPANTITVQLDRPRAVRWTMRAQARNSSLIRPVSFATLGKRKQSLYAMCALLWASLVEKDHDFTDPEDLAEYLQTDDQQVAALTAIRAIFEEAYPEKKKPDNSTNGPGPSSSLESAAQLSTSGN